MVELNSVVMLHWALYLLAVHHFGVGLLLLMLLPFLKLLLFVLSDRVLQLCSFLLLQLLCSRLLLLDLAQLIFQNLPDGCLLALSFLLCLF